jgi:hypothetical protein
MVINYYFSITYSQNTVETPYVTGPTLVQYALYVLLKLNAGLTNFFFTALN